MQVTSQLTLKIPFGTGHSAVLSFNLGFLAAVNQARSHKAIKPVFKVIFEFSCCSSKCFICYIIAADEDYVSIAPLFFFNLSEKWEIIHKL